MEFMFVLAGLFFIVGPIVLFFLVIGARRRIEFLERDVRELRTRMSAREAGASAAQWTAVHAASAAAEASPATEDIGHAGIDYGPVFVPEAAPIGERFPRPESPVAIDPLTVSASDATASESFAPSWRPAAAEPAEASLPPAPPAWLLKAKAWLLGGNLVAKAGLLILFFGVSFLLKYAAARFSTPIELRLAGIAAADIGLLLWGWRIRDSRPAVSLPVQGTALGILMLVTFGAFRLYDLIPAGLAFALLFVLTFFTCLLAVLQNALWLAIFGIVGGFAAPILTSTGHGNHVALFSYYALLNAGILAIALKRSWRWLNLLGFAFTFLIGTTWGVLRYQPENYLSVQGFLILFFVFYVVIAIFYASKQAPQLKHYVDGTLVFGTPLLAFGLQFGIVRDKEFGLAFSALALGLFYLALTLALWQRRGHTLKLLVESFLALGIVFGTLAIPFALDGRWTSAAWALEGAGIVWVGLRQKQRLAWIFGLLVQVGAWLSFVASVSGLHPEIAAQSNLWLGFLLLAGTGLVMAMNFRQESLRQRTDGEAPTSPWITTLAAVFLGSAAVWLLAGAWTEIYLRGEGHAFTKTFYVLSAMGVAAILGLIASRLDWRIARYFALVPQLLAGLVFLWLLDFNLDSAASVGSDNLFETGFLGALLIALGAGVSSLAFHRQADDKARQLSHMLLGWCAFWWFAYVLGSLNAWGEQLLARYNLFSEMAYPPVHPLYGLFLALGAPAFVLLARRLQWGALRWLACAVWPGLLVAMFHLLLQLDRQLFIPPGLVWLDLLALWLASEWLLRDSQRDGWLPSPHQPVILRVVHTMRIIGPWLILWPLGHHLVTLGLRPDSAAQAALLDEAGWSAADSWARYLPAWAMMAYLAVLIPRARAGRWPCAPIADWYSQVLIPLGALCSLLLVVIWNFTHNGLMAPLPYLPLLNPLDLSTGFAALLAVASWRLARDAGAPRLPARLPAQLLARLPELAAVGAYLWFNLMLLRTAAFFLDIPYQFGPLFQSQFVQAMLSLVWSATALVLMRFAAGRLLRTPWMAGAGLLVLVVAKLFMVDLSNVGGIERIVSFLGVGALMLAIGYLAPFPSEKAAVAK